MQQDLSIAHVIQLSVAPVFLLSGIGAMLSVMTNRLARIVDRAREWEKRTPSDHAEAREIEVGSRCCRGAPSSRAGPSRCARRRRS